ncbi:MAG: sensor histidine kinase [Eubacteriales bacterium]|nr:sensor histidine kinase [Eubacteriales bacterium]
MNRWIQKLFSNAKVQRQLVTTFLLTITLPLLAIGLFLLIITNRNLTQHYQEQANSDNLRVKSIFLDTTLTVYNLAETLASDSTLTAILTNTYESDAERYRATDNYDFLKNVLAKNASLETLCIYSPNESLGDFGYFATFTDEIRETDWYKQASETVTPFWKIHTRISRVGAEYQELTLFWRIPLIQSGDFAVAVWTVSDNYLRNRIENNSFETIACVNQDPCFYTTDRTKKGDVFPLTLDSETLLYNAQGTLELTDNTRAIGCVSTLIPYRSNDAIYILSLDRDAINTIHKTTFSYGILVIASLLFPFLLYYLFSRYFSARVVTLRNAMHQAGSGNYNIIDHFQGNDELSEAFGDLKTMIGEIQETEARMYQAQINEQKLLNQQQQMEFKLLASQINPHFLYNTLETIRMKAFTAGNKDVAKAIKLLGKSLRYVLENTGTTSTTLDKELSYIETYLSIQKVRFGDQVSYALDAPPGLDLSQYQILPLLLQPIVENAFSHGLEGNGHCGEIRITIREEDSTLCITVSDNGVGMTKEELEALRLSIQAQDQARTRSIGLYNINQRIKLCYGREHGLEIDSAPGAGTSVTLRLPQNKLDGDE